MTPLVTRAAPPTPCAEALYVPLVQRVLRRRLTHTIFLYTHLYSLLHAGAWAFLYRSNTPNNNTVMSVLRWLGMGFLGGVLPVLLRAGAARRARRSHAALRALATRQPGLFLAATQTQTVLAALYALRAVLRDVFVIPFRDHYLTPATPARPTHPGALLAPLLLPSPSPLRFLSCFRVEVVASFPYSPPAPSFPYPPTLSSPPIPLLRRLLGATPVLARGLQIRNALANAKNTYERCANTAPDSADTTEAASAWMLFLPAPRKMPFVPPSRGFVPRLHRVGVGTVSANDAGFRPGVTPRLRRAAFHRAVGVVSAGDGGAKGGA
ncbi:hypothetical protein C8J57DRAFT_1255924 [Mycena rebaudengoi]|nr:hypothetical protein C8J57DRAFT_1255924 [Mycena rebaudengoi]